MRFWDSSALTALLLREPSTIRVLPVLRQEPEIAGWWGSRVECASALGRAVRSGAISRREERDAWHRLAGLWDGGLEVEPTEELRDRAVRLLAVHSLRAADALQLAAALDWCEGRTAGRGFVCLDSRLRAAAMREGFDVYPVAEEVHEDRELAF